MATVASYVLPGRQFAQSLRALAAENEFAIEIRVAVARRGVHWLKYRGQQCHGDEFALARSVRNKLLPTQPSRRRLLAHAGAMGLTGLLGVSARNVKAATLVDLPFANGRRELVTNFPR